MLGCEGADHEMRILANWVHVGQGAHSNINEEALSEAIQHGHGCCGTTRACCSYFVVHGCYMHATMDHNEGLHS